MVVSAIMQIAAAAPIGALFGLAYGTSIRIGYEQIYPALFGDKEVPKDVDTTIHKMHSMFDAVGGKEASLFGINIGIKKALQEIDADPELIALIKKNSQLDTQNITVNSLGNGLVTQDGRVISSPPSAGLSDLSKVLSDQEVLDARYAKGDIECSSKYQPGSKVDSTFQWCTLPNGSIRPYPGTETDIKHDTPTAGVDTPPETQAQIEKRANDAAYELAKDKWEDLDNSLQHELGKWAKARAANIQKISKVPGHSPEYRHFRQKIKEIDLYLASIKKSRATLKKTKPKRRDFGI